LCIASASQKRKKGNVGFKLDFHKAYNSLEWVFICRVLKAIGFDTKIIDLIFQCISTVSFTLLLNGCKSASFSPSKGIRQGDPLSLYLFILCSEVLAHLINRDVERGQINGLKIAPRAPPISKLLYVDDVLLFCGAKINEVSSLLRCVEKYCVWSSQLVSIDKSGVFVSKGVHPHFCRQIKDQWGFKTLPKDAKYLRLPLFLTHKKAKDFSFVKERLESKVSGWKRKCLSWSGRAILIKSVAQSILSYAMSAFKLLKGLCFELDAMFRKFWWNLSKDGSRYFTPMAWTKLCKPLCDGGLGFRSFQTANEALIAKLVWWVLSSRDCFCIKVLRAKYKVGPKWLDSSLASNASFSWRGLESSKALLCNGACKLVGSSENTLVWEDPWVPDLPAFRPHPKNELVPKLSWSVAHFMKPDKSDWNIDLLKQVFYDLSVHAILNIPKWSSVEKDKWIWTKTPNGILTTKSAFKEILTETNSIVANPLLSKIWKLQLHDCLKMHLWRLAASLLPTKDIIFRFASALDSGCVLCENHVESVVHLFWECSLVRAIWFGSKWRIHIDQLLISSLCQLVQLIVDPPNELNIDNSDKIAFTLYGSLILDQIWKVRNLKVHEGTEVEIVKLMRNLASLDREHSC
jgi:hypothetical protein